MIRITPTGHRLAHAPRKPPLPLPGTHPLVAVNRPIIGHPREPNDSNWSGAVIYPPDNAYFYTIGADWTVPNAMPPPEALISADPNASPIDVAYIPGTYFVSIWIGLDGDYNNQVVQVGTFQCVTVKDDSKTICVKVKAFCQWYPCDQIVLCDVDVAVGDLVSCKLIASKKSNTADIYFSNLTKGTKSKGRTIGAPTGLCLAGTSAEWIVERPSDPDDKQIQPLANYGSHIFYGASASSVDEKGKQTDYTLTNSKLVDMEDSNGDIISKAFPVSADATRTRYRNLGS